MPALDECARLRGRVPRGRSLHKDPTRHAAATDNRVPFDKGGYAHELVLTNARVVMRDAMYRGTVHVVGGCIAGIDTRVSGIASAIDLEGDFLIPGLVDIHTDNLERHLEPRPGVAWPSFAALVSHDRQIAAAGVTTVFDSLCVGDQRRGIARRLAALVESSRPSSGLRLTACSRRSTSCTFAVKFRRTRSSKRAQSSLMIHLCGWSP